MSHYHGYWDWRLFFHNTSQKAQTEINQIY